MTATVLTFPAPTPAADQHNPKDNARMGTNISYARGEEAALGGLDITISLTPAEFAALGDDIAALATSFDATLWTLVMLRTGRVPRRAAFPEIAPGDWGLAIKDLNTSLLPRLEGMLDAAIRGQTEAGGTLEDLAGALDSTETAAAILREGVITRACPSRFERWATQPGA